MSMGLRGPSDVAVHEFVQLLAGWVPDDKLAAVRRTLADGQTEAAADTALAMVAEYDVPMLPGSIDAARSLAGKPGVLKDVRPVARYPRLPFWFSPLGPGERIEADELDLTIARAAQARSALIAGVWRAWRFPQDGFDELCLEDEPRAEEEIRPSAAIDPDDQDLVHRVYIVQVLGGAVAPTVAGELQPVLAGRKDAGVEVIGLDIAPGSYQARALSGAALLSAVQDVLDTGAGQVVRGSFRTGGEWI
jgi:hypothetical protein